jgi:hypothetical protein
MGGYRPQPMTVGDEYLALLLDELARQGEVLAEIRDRFPQPSSKGGEPAAEPAAEPVEVELREPEQPKPRRRRQSTKG